MKTLSIRDAQEFFKKLNPSYYLFSTENQKKRKYYDCISIVSRYSEVIFSMFTNRIYFKNDNDSLCISNVKCVRIDDRPSIGTAFYVVCEGNEKNKREKVFTFLAD